MGLSDDAVASASVNSGSVMDSNGKSSVYSGCLIGENRASYGLFKDYHLSC